MADDDDENTNSNEPNTVKSIIQSTVFVIVAAYAGSSFIYFLHKINRKNKENSDRNKDSTSAIPGSYMFGSPYFPVNSDDEAKRIANLSYENRRMKIDKIWNKHCPKYFKTDEDGNQSGKSNIKDRFFDKKWAAPYSNKTFCDEKNLRIGILTKILRLDTTVVHDIVSKFVSFLKSFFISETKDMSSLTEVQKEYRSSFSYYTTRYILMMQIGVYSSLRYLMNLLITPFVRISGSSDEATPDNRFKSFRRNQVPLVILFSILSSFILYGLAFVGSLWGVFAPYVFAIYDWNFYDMLTWPGFGVTPNLIMMIIYFVLSLLIWIFGIVLMFQLPALLGIVNTVVIPIVIAYLFFIEPLFDTEQIIVSKTRREADFHSSGFQLRKINEKLVPIEVSGKIIEKSALIKEQPKLVESWYGGNTNNIPDKVCVSRNIITGKFQIEPSLGVGRKHNDIEEIDATKCYKKQVYKLNGFSYVNRLVWKYVGIWGGLWAHKVVKALSLQSEYSQLTLVGNPASISFNVGTGVYLLSILGYIAKMYAEKRTPQE